MGRDDSEAPTPPCARAPRAPVSDMSSERYQLSLELLTVIRVSSIEIHSIDVLSKTQKGPPLCALPLRFLAVRVAADGSSESS